MRLQDQVFEVYKEHLNTHMEENRREALLMKEMVELSPLNHKGVLDKTLQIPKVYDAETVARFREITDPSGFLRKSSRHTEGIRNTGNSFPFPGSWRS